MDALNLTIDDLITPGVKILDGIAGAAKTSQVVRLLQENDVPYLHTTSTNKLCRDITERFGTPAKTIAGAFFTNENADFYTGEKDTEATTVILDEILQTPSTVFTWIKNHHEKVNIIACTDSKQMLAPVTGEASMRAYLELASQPYCKIYGFDVTHRPVNDYTYAMFYSAYSSDSDSWDLFSGIPHKKTIYCTPETIPEYSSENVYLCHSNDVERVLYHEWELSKHYELDLIPKGMIASKQVKDPSKYPILPQLDASKNMGYWQVSNIGSVVRYQGSEVLPGKTLYYFIGKNDHVPSNRETYTMLTRMKDINSLIVVRIDMSSVRDIPLTVYMDKPIIPQRLYISDEFDPKTKQEYNQELNKINMENDNVYYYDIISMGKTLSKRFRTPIERVKLSAWGIAKKDPGIKLTTPNLFFKTISDTGYRGEVSAPSGIDPKLTWALPEDVSGEDYGVDLQAAYPHCWKNYGLPDGRTYRPGYGGQVNLYLVTDGHYFAPGTIMTEDLFLTIAKYDSEWGKAVFIGSIDKLPAEEDKAVAIAEKLRTTSKESKAELKKVQWGWFLKDYLSEVKGGKAYIINPAACYLLVMVFIQSELSRVTLEIKNEIFGTVRAGRSFVDCVYFNGDYSTGEIVKLGDRLQKIIPGYDFRIFHDVGESKTNNNPVLYQTFERLLSREEKARLKRNERRAEKKKEEPTPLVDDFVEGMDI